MWSIRIVLGGDGGRGGREGSAAYLFDAGCSAQGCAVGSEYRIGQGGLVEQRGVFSRVVGWLSRLSVTLSSALWKTLEGASHAEGPLGVGRGGGGMRLCRL